MKRYLSGGGSRDSNREVSEDKVCSKERAAAALRMRSEDALADTVSKESASAMKPGCRAGRDLVRSAALRYISKEIIDGLDLVWSAHPGSPGWSSTCLGPLAVCLSMPRCPRSSAGTSVGDIHLTD